MKVTEEMIERGARALLASYAGQTISAADWRRSSKAVRRWWEERAKAVLEAALGGDESADNAGDD